MKKIVPFVGSSYEHSSTSISSQRTLNFYPEIVDNSDGKVQMALIQTEGQSLYCKITEAGTSPIRGQYTVNTKQDVNGTITGRTFVVAGGQLAEVHGENDYTIRGIISDLSSRPSFCHNDEHMVIVDGVDMWTYDLATEQLQEVNLPFTNPTAVAYVNERVICINEDPDIDVVRNYNKFYFSDINDARSWSALSWYNSQGEADPIIGLQKKEGEIWLMGPSSYEAWRANPNGADPFSRVGGSFGEIGLGAKFGSTALNNNIYWFGSGSVGKNQVFTSNGYGAQRISTHAIEHQLNKIESTRDCVVWSYQKNGHDFVVFTFISGNQTWVYDASNGMWHERGTREPFTNRVNRWAPTVATFGNEKILVGSSEGPDVLLLSDEVYTDYSELSADNTIPIVRERTSPIYWNNLSMMFHMEFTLDMEVGVGVQQLVQGNDPVVALQFSNDGGYSWSSEITKPMGKIGERLTRVQWRRLGRSVNRCYRIRITDPVKATLLNVRIDSEIGENT
jgi:hypothetical protein